MAENKENIEKRDRSFLFQKLRDSRPIVMVRKQAEGLVAGDEYTKYLEQDPFEGVYSDKNLVEPPYGFADLYRIYEQSDVLQECVDAFQQNVDGFGYALQFLGDDIKEKKSKEAQKQFVRGMDFFDQVNDEQSFLTVRKLLRADFEILGNGALECIRNRAGLPQLLFHLPFVRLRAARIDRMPTMVNVIIQRDGKPVQLRVPKYFRRYCQVSASGQKLRWFKQFGDPRMVDAITGEYVIERPRVLASEIIHFKIPMKDYAYGVPRWVGAVLDVMGRRNAQYVNYDLFENQGIPPLAVLVSGGELSDESFDELESLLQAARGATKFNRAIVLEANATGQGLEDSGNAKIELKNLSEYRKEDQMFSKYLGGTEDSTRRRYRLPPVYTGASSDYTYASAKTSKQVAEEQIFVPERAAFDEIANMTLTRNLGIDLWWYLSKGPQIVGSEEIARSVNSFTSAGAFSANHAIEMANQAFGLEMSKYDEAWANYPFPMVVELIKLGLPGVAPKELGGNGEPPPARRLLPAASEKEAFEVVMKSDLWTDEEKALYKKLREIQYATQSKRG